MAISTTKGALIKGIISVVPQNVEDNLTTVLLNTTDREALIAHTGIRYRRRVLDSKASIKALITPGINSLLEQLDWDISTIDVLICVTQTASVSIPSVACQLHGDLNFHQDVIAYDINSGCSGFVYGLHTVSQLLSSLDKSSRRAILCCGDISSSITDDNDLSVRPIFSDAISVIALEDDGGLETSGTYNLETIGAGQNAIYTSETAHGRFMKLDGIDVFNYSVTHVPNNITRLLNHLSKPTTFPDLYIFHQANMLINESIRRAIDVEKEKVPNSLYDFGNTASASIPLTLSTSWNKKVVESGWILISGFGVGFSVASALVKFNPSCILPPLSIDL